MKKLSRRILSVLSLMFCLGLAAPSAADEYLVPLDDRPANRLFVEQLYRIGSPDGKLHLPPRNLLGRLYNPGDSDGVIEWLEKRVKPRDTVFISADMWLYGGLVASRTSGIETSTLERRLKRLADLAARGVTVHVLATVPRLSLRTSARQAPHELTISKWAAKADLPGGEELLRALRSGSEVQLPDGVPPEIVKEYLEVRERNVDTIVKLIEMCAGGSIQSLILGQDDSNKTGLHQSEQARIRREIESGGLRDKVKLLSGIDELSMDLVSGYLAKKAGVTPSVRVVYSEPDAADKIPPLESLPLAEMIEQHMELAGARLEYSDRADLDLYVYVPYSQPWKVPGEERRPEAEAFVERVREAQLSGRRVAVADLSLVNRMDPFLAESSLEKLSLQELEGFASWNTPANTAGTVIAQLVCHQIAERSPHWNIYHRLESEKTHQAFMFARFIDDYAYQTVVRDDVRGQTTSLSSEADPLLNLFGPVGLEIRVRLIEWANRLFEQHYLGRAFCLVPQNKQVVFQRSKLEVVLPWPRIFEVEARLDLRLLPSGKSCDEADQGP